MWLLVIFLIAPALAFNEHISYSEFLNCKEFRSPANSRYETQYFSIKSFENNKPTENDFFRIKFFILASTNVSITLIDNPLVTPKEHIVISRYNISQHYQFY